MILFTPGEVAAAAYTGYLTERTLTGMIAAAVGGAAVVIERKEYYIQNLLWFNLIRLTDRYWGDSSPCEVQTTTCLQDLTLQQAVDDFVNFAQNVPLPFDTTNSTNADQAVCHATPSFKPKLIANVLAALGLGRRLILRSVSCMDRKGRK